MELPIYIVKHNKHSIAKASAIIGAPNQRVDGFTMVYYEGNLFDAENLRAFEDRCCVAAGRAAKAYPTVAKMTFPSDELVRIGTYDTDTWTIAHLEPTNAFLMWLTPDPQNRNSFTLAEIIGLIVEQSQNGHVPTCTGAEFSNSRTQELIRYALYRGATIEHNEMGGPTKIMLLDSSNRRVVMQIASTH